ncbi:ABC transporter ATP-binding protein [Lysinibacillus sp. FSL K6-0232]|uniref:ABC transporter ATP-binding protein n=1 Tax=unclassified Lysinibacillus TaxID=2636778 RepID=UPI0030FC078F
MLVKVENVQKKYVIKEKTIFRKKYHHIINGVSLYLNQGECLGIIGESGSGKSTLSRMILGIEKPNEGNILMDGHNFWEVSSAQRKALKREISIVFQDYTSSVNPNFTVKEIIAEPLFLLKNVAEKEKSSRITELLYKVELDDSFLERYPHELSGGQLQRVCIARAIATKPKLVVLDEAISSLDVSIQLKILDLLIKLKEEEQLSYIFITHDLMTLTYICDRVCFLKDGRIVEQVQSLDQLTNVSHPYAQGLLNAVLHIEQFNANKEVIG